VDQNNLVVANRKSYRGDRVTERLNGAKLSRIVHAERVEGEEEA
jgi:hypothetical protein